MDTNEQQICQNCTEPVDGTVFIECAECGKSQNANDSGSASTSSAKTLLLCLECFSCGAELGSHKRTHRYFIRTPTEEAHLFSGSTLSGDNEPWSVKEEFGLLNGIERFNLGNWEDIANHYVKASNSLCKRTPTEIMEHYDRYYLHGPLGRVSIQGLHRPNDRDYSVELSVTVDAESSDDTKPALKIAPSPPMKESLRKISPDDFRLLAYMPQRDDFEKEFNNDVETLISNLMILPDDDDLDKAVKVAQIEMYIREVAERQRRKAVTREYDLVSLFLKQEKCYSSSKSYSYSVPEQKKLKMERELKDQLKTCAQFVPMEEFDQLMSDIVKERTLKERIKELQEYRQAGVTTLEGEKRFKEKENSTSKPQRDADAQNEFVSQTAPRKTSTDGTEFGSGKSGWRNQTIEMAPVSTVLSRMEEMLCEECSLSAHQYIVLKTALLKEQVAKWNGLPLRTTFGGGGDGLGVDDVLQLKGIVKNFMKRSGWIPYFS